MDFLYLLEKIRVPVLNEFMLFITRLGEETAFLVIALTVFWCVDKYKGYYILCVGFLGTIANQFMKLWFRIPRPWIIDENFTILEQAREAASGYSFPSGHTQNAVGTFGGLAYMADNKWVRVVALSIAVLVPFSRMYIGVHTPLDVFAAVVMAVLLVLLLKPFVLKNGNKYVPVLFGVMTVLAICFLCFVELYQFPVEIDLHNLESGRSNAYTLLGAMLGLIVVYIVDEKWLNFSTKAIFLVQVEKVLFGLALVLAVKSGLKPPLNMLFGNYIGRAIRYFLVVVVAGSLWPFLFDKIFKFSIKE